MDSARIRIHNASEHNLKHISLELPHYQLIVITGVSGSGKSSLAFDVIAREGQRRYLETFSSFSRQFMGKLSRPHVESVEGLFPVITLGQRTTSAGSRSTVGTLSELYDWLRLLFARLGQSPHPVVMSRSLFSFNSPEGACPACHGLGQEERISLEKLITDPTLSLRQGVLSPSLPNGYIMYSQVTLEVLNLVCQAHGFDIDIPWKDLTEEQQKVVFFGSDRIKVPFGKHPLENRLKWTGITAKPREEDYYRGLVNIMTDILRRDRNDNILRYAEAVTCSQCLGRRLRPETLEVTLHGQSIADLSSMDLETLRSWLLEQPWTPGEKPVAGPVVQKMSRQLEYLIRLGLEHLTLDRPAGEVSPGDSQRIRLVNLLNTELSHVTYVFDEPTIGLHPSEKEPLLQILRNLVERGNTVIVVEHDETTIRSVGWIVDMGPGPGIHGGEILYNGPFAEYMTETRLGGVSPTWDWLHRDQVSKVSKDAKEASAAYLEMKDCSAHNLDHLDVAFRLASINVVTGVSGSGKSTLVHHLLEKTISARLSGHPVLPEGVREVSGHATIDKIIRIDQQPIGRTPRSNPATYTGWADKLRDLFAGLESSKTAGFTRTNFSFNTPGGRCETCQGAGSLQVGMHFLGNVDVPCPDCEGRRFHDEVLEIHYKDKNIAEVLELTVEQALAFFTDRPELLKPLQTLSEIGLGYLGLGQASSTLSGGEAQRIRLARELQQKSTGKTLYLLDGPTTGLHTADIEKMISVLRKLSDKGNTIVCVEQDETLLRNADRIIHLGPGSGRNGGKLMYQGPFTPDIFPAVTSVVETAGEPILTLPAEILLKGVTTHLLKNIDVRFPAGKLTVITGVSGSGKSSLAFDTLYAEAQSRFTESLSAYARSLIRQSNPARVEEVSGLMPAVAINRKYFSYSSRSTVGTMTGIYDHYRLLYSRLSTLRGRPVSSSHFSFNHQSGACPVCEGLGYRMSCDPLKLITRPGSSITDGAMAGHKQGAFYGDPYGQYMATLREVARKKNLDLDLPWSQLDEETQNLVLYGTGPVIWEVDWEFRNKTRSGIHHLSTTWEGFCNLVDEEYQRRHLNKNTREVENLLSELLCPYCSGTRLKPEVLDIQCQRYSIAELSALTVADNLRFFSGREHSWDRPEEKAVFEEIAFHVEPVLRVVDQLGLGYLSLDRSSRTLSGGEGQRIRLAGAFATSLYGVTYVLDEPTIGLSEKETIPLIGAIRELVGRGNTAVVVEHDDTFIRQADHLIEMGPGAGRQGGEVIAIGTPDKFENQMDTPTARYLRRPLQGRPEGRPVVPASFGIRGASLHNLKDLDVDFISGGIIAVTGVSGSGKSTLVREVLWRSAGQAVPHGCREVWGLSQFKRILLVDQKPLSTHALSTPATLTGMMDGIRDLFAATDEARRLGLKKAAFSYLGKEGKCPDCGGHGQKRTSMDFMEDVWVSCDTCQGSRYQPVVLQCRWKGMTMADILDMTIAEALPLFSEVPSVGPVLSLLEETGVSHLKLGQAANTLSGGESQRLHLAMELIHRTGGATLYLLDEPTTGLHSHDIEKLMKLFHRLAGEGNTILYIEHHKALLEMAGQLITLGPEGGPRGGYLIHRKIR